MSLFGFGPEWTIVRLTVDAKLLRIDIYIVHSGKNLVCPETGEAGTLYDHREERTWRHRNISGCMCYVHCRVPRVETSSGIKTIEVPWASRSSRVTYAFECIVVEVLKETKNQTKTAELLNCSFNQIHRIMHRCVARGMARRTLADILHVSIDEKALKRGHVYATVVCDSTRGIVLDVGLGRTKKGTIELLLLIFAGISDKVETITADMWRAFRGAVEVVFPKAALIHDRFHLIKYLNDALNKVRRREVKQHPKELKGSRFALLKNEENRTESQEEIFQVIQEANLEVSVAWRLREDFKAIFNCTSYAEAEKDVNLWIDSVEKTGMKEVIKVAKMFKEHFTGVCNALCHPQSNAQAERMNGKIQEIKSIGRGFRRFENFRVAILFFCGGLDLYPQISW